MKINKFFDEEFSNAINKTNLKITSLSKNYVVSVLCDLNEINFENETLFSFYERALTTFNSFNEYRQLGDTALLTAGVFTPFISRRASLVNEAYYIKMGKSGYFMASKLLNKNGFSLVFEELCDTFEKVVFTLNNMEINLC